MRAAVVVVALALAAGFGLLTALAAFGAPRASTPLTGTWTGAGHKLNVSGTLEGGFTISAGESWSIIGCPISTGTVLSQYSPKGGSSYSVMYLWTENEGGKCTNSTRGPETVTVTGSSTSLSITGCGYAFCASLSRPKPATPTTTAPKPPATTAPPATTRPRTTTTTPAKTVARDTRAPVVAVIGGKGKPGAKIKLGYRVSDDSGKTKDTVSIMRGNAVVAGPKTSALGPAIAGRDYWVNWTAPATVARGVVYRFCVRSVDAAGNQSPTRCVNIGLLGDTTPPEVHVFAKGATYPATRSVLDFSVRDDSGKATYHATMYQGGRAVDTATATVASGRQEWSLLFASDLSGPLYWCAWAADAAGNKSAQSCAWITFVVPVDRVANGCGGGVQKWDVGVLAQNYFGNVHNYFDFGSGHTYTVNFAPACDLHDAGYGGHAVKNDLRGGGVRDYRGWTRKQVDDQFLADMRLLCNRGIPESADGALSKCVEGAPYYALPVNHLIGAETLYGFVRKFGDRFFDSNLAKPGLQRFAENAHARDHLPG